MVYQKEIKIKYPEARVRAINSNLAKKNTTIEVEIMAAGNVRFEDDQGGGTECPPPWCFYEKNL